MPKDLKSAFDILQTAKNGGVRLKSLMESEKIKLENIEQNIKE